MGAQSAYEIIDPRFGALVNGNARADQLFTGCKWAEGPAWFGAGRYLVWSDIPNNRQMRYDETDGSVSVFRSPSNYSNGNTVDRQGRQVTCEHGARRDTRTEHDGTNTVIADRFEGKRFNSPNDYEGHKAESEIGRCNVYRVDPKSGAITAVITDMVRPNGLAFSIDEKNLYVADTGRTHGAQNPKHIRVFDVKGNKLSGGREFAECTAGLFDGFRLDVDGRIWTSAEDGVHCYEPDGTLIGKILVPEVVANVCFGGVKRNRLYICGTTSLYAIYIMTNGAKTYRSGLGERHYRAVQPPSIR